MYGSKITHCDCLVDECGATWVVWLVCICKGFGVYIGSFYVYAIILYPYYLVIHSYMHMQESIHLGCLYLRTHDKIIFLSKAEFCLVMCHDKAKKNC